MNCLKKLSWRKGYVYAFVFIMILQVISPCIEVRAYELGKVRLSDTRGTYFQTDVNPDLKSVNKEQSIKQEVLKKEAVTFDEDTSTIERQEVIEKRTINSKTYKLKDGSFVSETFFEPIHKKEEGVFVDIDNEIKVNKKARSLPSYENKDGLYAFKVIGNLMTMENDKKQSLSIMNTEANLSVLDHKENVLLYSEAYKNIDLEYRLYGDSVATNFYINGPIEQKEIRLKLLHEALETKETEESIAFQDANGNVVFRFIKPTMYDQNGASKELSCKIVSDGSMSEVIITIDNTWINQTKRSYPVLMQARAVDASTTINVDTAYIRSKEPDVTSTYHDLFVGYDDGYASGVTNGFGKSRTYVHIGNLKLEKNQLIVDAQLQLYKKTAYDNEWNTINVRETSSYIKPESINWNNKPETTSISTTKVRSDRGWQLFNVTEYVKDIYAGKNKTLELRATDESSAYMPTVFSSEAGLDSSLPRVSIRYRDDFEVDPELDVNTFDTEMRIYSKKYNSRIGSFVL